jgi:hypothetical protein
MKLLPLSFLLPLCAFAQRCDPAGASTPKCAGAFDAGFFEARDCRQQSPCPKTELCIDYKSRQSTEALSTTIAAGPLPPRFKQRIGVCSARPCTVNEVSLLFNFWRLDLIKLSRTVGKIKFAFSMLPWTKQTS